MIDKIIRYVLIGLLVISVGGNVFFIAGKGINIDKRQFIDQRQDQSQHQYQGQVSLNYFQAYGSKLKWKFIKYNSLELATKGMNELPDQYAVLADKPQQFRDSDGTGKWGHWVPEFMTEVKK